MRIRYEVTVEDLIAFQQHQYAHDAEVQRQLRRWKWTNAGVIFASGAVWPAVLPFLAGVFGGSAGAYAVSLSVSCLTAVGYWISHPKLVKRRLDAFLIKHYAQGDHRTVVGEHELELHEDGFVERTQYNENKTAWGALAKIDSAPGYTYLCVGTSLVYVVPHGSVSEGSLRDFLAELGTRYKPDARLELTSNRILTPD